MEVEKEKESSEFEFFGYDNSQISLRWLLFWLCVLFTGGILLFICIWLPDLYIYLSTPPCPLSRATHLIVRKVGATRSITTLLSGVPGMANTKIVFTCKVHVITISPQGRFEYLRFVCKCVRFYKCVRTRALFSILNQPKPDHSSLTLKDASAWLTLRI